ncbi:(2Fe-2S) ferredoxin domain-containing protein [Phormidium pseudopriestleyi FRX01]|uniref:(2Fe-2S) ferredoxin domain-containing protein n=1 Tax=Phormidium pseudopriestleyi FRX01 TaxID=1759528 RepID=A0ABS3FSY2_9CYAN|nr:(2Fe-2S) ferredoxin domain-containing protein [Phormidium pseudopriestleyi]MBO0350236.1 (2Fe-2S) ferredoxin domain-containing protein [Phormidium pseudopriestleyi FRX01]
MGKSYKQTSELNLEGRFLGFGIPGGKNLKYFRLATGEGERFIKLDMPKKQRAILETQLTPGDWVRAIGEKQLNLKTGLLKLKAYHILPALNSVSSEPVPIMSPVSGCDHFRDCAIAETCASSPPPIATLEPIVPEKKKATILICQKSDCRKKGGAAVCKALEEQLRQKGLEDNVTIKGTGCMSRCKAGPNVVVMPDKARYTKIQPEDIPDLIANHF